MAEANFDIDPIPYDANTPELDLDVEMEDSGDERGEANFMADIEVLDALYLRETIESNNQKIQTLNHSIAYLISRSWGIALHDCAVRESPCMIVQLGNRPA